MTSRGNHAADEEVKANKHKVDLFRDTPIRYLGYANEVGEAFRAQVHVNLVRLSYAVASSYVCADAYSKGKECSELPWGSDSVRNTKVTQTVLDTFLWQALASVIIPGITINRICFGSNILLGKVRSLPVPARKWAVTGIGLASIPFIIKPIDRGVDLLMEGTVRKWYGIGPILEEKVVHHKRND